jgi:hypothetical protein
MKSWPVHNLVIVCFTHSPTQYRFPHRYMPRAEHVSGAENGAERAEKLVSGSEAVSGTFEKG